MYPNLKLQLWTTGIRQNRLAKLVAIDETTLSRIVNGFRIPSEEMRGRIAAVLQSDEDWLFQKVEGKSEFLHAPARQSTGNGGQMNRDVDPEDVFRQR